MPKRKGETEAEHKARKEREKRKKQKRAKTLLGTGAARKAGEALTGRKKRLKEQMEALGI